MAVNLWAVVGLLLLGVNAGLVVLNGILSWRLWRRIRHVIVLDQLLMRLCVTAFRRQSQPVWMPWMRSMGEITVEITAKRKQWTDE
jgi:hypothetical protein